ncbi:MAG: EAL domain-containing protein, partial [Candidatus Dadabacteria bacterium]
LWEWDVPDDRLDVSERWWQLLGFEAPPPGDGTIEEWYSRVHPADLGRLRSLIGEFIRQDNADGYIQDVVRVLRKDGLWTWMRMRAVAERDAQGVAVRLAGTMSPMRGDGAWDWLTGLPNRLLFEEQAASSATHLAEGQTGAIIYLGIDRLSALNEAMGHGAGDRALLTIASRIEAALRPGDIAGRFSGDEFAVCLSSVPDAAFAHAFARQLLLGIAQPQRDGEQQYSLTASAGLALFEGAAGERASRAIDEARAAMYAAKEAGGNELVEYQTGMKESLQKAVSLQRALTRALRDEEFELWYQPIYRLGRIRRLAGFEALIRWSPTRDGGLYRSRDVIAPAHFIPFAEESGQIVDIGAWVIGEALRQMRAWFDELGLSRLPAISVNLSARQFADTRLVGLVQDEIIRSGLPAQLLRFELTETMLVQDVRVSLQRMNALRKIGVSLVLDDFGTGYSSLSYLHQYPVNALKIDQSFVRGIDVAPEKQKIVRMITMLARTLELDVVAEGVENRAHLRLVRKLGCGYGQGMLLGRPATAAATAELLRTSNLDPRTTHSR